MTEHLGCSAELLLEELREVQDQLGLEVDLTRRIVRERSSFVRGPGPSVG
jgi:hypothetical protein